MGVLILMPNSSSGGQVVNSVSITTNTLNEGYVGISYNQQLQSQSASPSAATSVSWAVGSGSLPAGLSLSDSGLLSGTPTATDSQTVMIEATLKSSNGSVLATANKSFLCTVVQNSDRGPSQFAVGDDLSRLTIDKRAEASALPYPPDESMLQSGTNTISESIYYGTNSVITVQYKRNMVSPPRASLILSDVASGISTHPIPASFQTDSAGTAWQFDNGGNTWEFPYTIPSGSTITQITWSSNLGTPTDTEKTVLDQFWSIG
jgi:hypothetical protein